jgi:hypothetical protein
MTAVDVAVDQALLRDACRELLDEQATPERLRAALNTPTGHDADLWKQATELGWTSLALPERLGGLDGGLPDLAVVVEQCGRALMPTAVTGVSGAAWVLARHALDHDLLPALAAGGAVPVWSLHRPGETGALRARVPAARSPCGAPAATSPTHRPPHTCCSTPRGPTEQSWPSSPPTPPGSPAEPSTPSTSPAATRRSYSTAS